MFASGMFTSGMGGRHKADRRGCKAEHGPPVDPKGFGTTQAGLRPAAPVIHTIHPPVYTETQK
jgi:hypothetical protein